MSGPLHDRLKASRATPVRLCVAQGTGPRDLHTIYGTGAQDVSLEERFHVHQSHSGPVVDALHAWLCAQLNRVDASRDTRLPCRGPSWLPIHQAALVTA